MCFSFQFKSFQRENTENNYELCLSGIKDQLLLLMPFEPENLYKCVIPNSRWDMHGNCALPPVIIHREAELKCSQPIWQQPSETEFIPQLPTRLWQFSGLDIVYKISGARIQYLLQCVRSSLTGEKLCGLLHEWASQMPAFWRSKLQLDKRPALEGLRYSYWRSLLHVYTLIALHYWRRSPINADPMNALQHNVLPRAVWFRWWPKGRTNDV